MADNDPFATQHTPDAALELSLESAGFTDLREIGRGGFGVVYRCAQPALDRTVAVKVLMADFDDVESSARFLREQRAMGRLTGHPNIASVLQMGTTAAGHPFLVMPYYARGCLRRHIHQNGPLGLEEVLRIGVKIAGALHSAHSLGVVHRDVKPANVLLSDYDEPMLSDFGIAHVRGGFETATGIVTGSPAFTAPEVLTGQTPGPASDVYSLGATLFCALTGHTAFERHSGEKLISQFVRITADPLPDLHERNIADDVSTAVQHAMNTSASDRCSMIDLGQALQQVQLNHGFSVDEMALYVRPDEKRPTKPKPPTPPTYDDIGELPKGRSGGNLPVELTSFVGRRREILSIKRCLEGSHLVTLAGFGGVGKTRLALHTAESMRRAFSDGTWLVECADLSDQSLFPDCVAVALGLRYQSTKNPREMLLNFLTPRELLLILDNCEQVLSAAAELSTTLLHACPRIRILVTSREPLNLAGETVFRVPPLTIPRHLQSPRLRETLRSDAVTLFAERATSAVSTFTLTDDNAGVVAQICHQLDGLPLPIELAAARLSAMSPEQILQRLSDRYALLTRGNRNAPSRQQTMRLCVDWSYELCSPTEQLLWVRLSVFAGSAELDAAERVCGQDLEPQLILDTLTSLVDKSILIREEVDSVVRFRLLDILRDYGRERAQSEPKYVELRRAHRDWYLQLALEAEADWISSRQLDWIARLARDQTNLREAMEFCLDDDHKAGLTLAAALQPFWHSRGLFREGRRWLERFLNQEWEYPTVERVKALHAHSILAELQGDLTAAAGSVAEGRALAQELAEPKAYAFVLRAEGALALYRGDFPRARRQLEMALKCFDPHESSYIEVLHLLGRACDQTGNDHKAAEYYSRALTITESCGEVVHRASTLRALGISAWRHFNHARAAQLVEQALALSRRVGNLRTTATCLEVLAWVAAEHRDAQRSAVLMGAAHELAQSIGSFTLWFPDLVKFHKDCEHAAARMLGSNYESSYQHGQRLGVDVAISYALGEKVPPTQPDLEVGVKLTKREHQIAVAVSEGLTNKAIATRLVISPRTVQGHVEHILTKLGFTKRAQIAAWIVANSAEAPPNSP